MSFHIAGLYWHCSVSWVYGIVVFEEQGWKRTYRCQLQWYDLIYLGEFILSVPFAHLREHYSLSLVHVCIIMLKVDNAFIEPQ